MAVSYQDGPDFVSIFFQISDVREDKVHPKHVRLRKQDASVYDHDVVATFNGHHVLANLTQPAKGYNPQFRR
jgi:hypothetical protein